MSYTYASLKPVLDCFVSDEPLGAKDITEKLWKDRSLIHRYLKELVSQWKLIKVWAWPQTKYKLAQPRIWEKNWESKHTKIVDIQLSYADHKLLNDLFYKFSPDGKILSWKEWFLAWCASRNLDPQEKLIQFTNISSYLETQVNICGMLDATHAFQKNMPESALDMVMYADQYKRMEFGRGKLAEMTFYAKQSQNISLINEAISLILPKIECVLSEYRIDAIALTPHSIKRTNQLLWVLKKKLKAFNLPFINIIKYYPHRIPIPQKSLKKREQRIKNARETIIVDDPTVKNYNNILLIDDFVWSWATLNETAKKLKHEGAWVVIWCAFVGNTDLSYEVINEV